MAVRSGAGGFWLLFGDEQGSAQLMMPATIGAGGALAAATQADADAVQRTAYDPYGARRGVEDLEINRGWLGQTEDAGTGLTYLNARYYDSAIGRFLSPDPLMDPGDPRTLDPYRYADNNPIVFMDPTGLCSTCYWDDLDEIYGGGPSVYGNPLVPAGAPTVAPKPKNQGGYSAADGEDVLLTAETIQNWFDQGFLVTRPGGMMSCGSWDCVNVSSGAMVRNYPVCAPGVTRDCWDRAIETQKTCADDDPYCETIGETFFSIMSFYVILIAYRSVGAAGGAPVRTPPANSPATGVTTQTVARPNLAPAVNWGQQAKHFLGHPNYMTGRSQLTANPELLAQRAGTGTPVGAVPRGQPGFKERIDFGFTIGNHVASKGAGGTPTSVGIIHYRADGSIHIVPGRPAP